MDIAKTIDLLNSQISKTKLPDVKDVEAKKLGAETKTNNTETSSTTTDRVETDTSQSTGEEFSTFLTLLTAQIKNQDPLAPLDSTQFVEQLATFSNLELQAKGNQSLDLIAALLVRQIELLTPEETPETTQETTTDTASVAYI